MNASLVQHCVAVSCNDPFGGAALAIPGIAEVGGATFLTELESAFASAQRTETERLPAAPNPNPYSSTPADALPRADVKPPGEPSTRPPDSSVRREETPPSAQEQQPLREQEPKPPDAAQSNAKEQSDASDVAAREGGANTLQQSPKAGAASESKAGESVSEHRGALVQQIRATPDGAGQSAKQRPVPGELNPNARPATKGAAGLTPAAELATQKVTGSRNATQLQGSAQLAQSRNVATAADASAKGSAAANEGVIQAALQDSVRKYGDAVDKREHPAALTKAAETNDESPVKQVSGQPASQESGRHSGSAEEKDGHVLWFGKRTGQNQELAGKDVAARSLSQVAATGQSKSRPTAKADGTISLEGAQGWRHYATTTTALTPRESIRAAARQVVDRAQSEVVEQARYLQQGGKSRLTIRLHPPELGRIRVEIELQEGQLKLKMEVENPELREALKEEAQNLERSLKDAQVDLGRMDVLDYQSGRQEDEQGRLDETAWQDAQQEDSSGQIQPEADTPRTWTLITDAGRVDCLV